MVVTLSEHQQTKLSLDTHESPPPRSLTGMSVANSYTLSSHLDNRAKGIIDWSVSQPLKKHFLND